jgi:predicted 3-demethylubiquinone-9 3-methyltransferase (glyoxalase superfamily)
MSGQKITPCLWFDGKAEEAAEHYCKLFGNSAIKHVSRYGDAGPGPKGQAMMVAFDLEGQSFQALNGGPQYKFTPAISMSISCTSQAEVDHFWNGLLEGGGVEQPCAWLVDRFGVSWQVVPDALPRLLMSSNPGAAGRVMQAMFKMKKIVIADLENAAAG